MPHNNYVRLSAFLLNACESPPSSKNRPNNAFNPSSIAVDCLEAAFIEGIGVAVVVVIVIGFC